MTSSAPRKPASDNSHQHRHAVYAAEAIGLLLMPVVLLMISVIRYRPSIPWSAR